MQVSLNGKEYEVVIERKIGNRNTYLRVKEDLKIYVTTNRFTTTKEIERIIRDNIESVERMIKKQEKRIENKEGFFYLGKKYDIIYTSTEGIVLGEKKVFLNRNLDLDKWYKKQAEKIFQEHLDACYNRFTKNIPYPSSLTIRRMTSRWGVCNTKTKRITLNLELIKKPIFCIDYVIMHELSHLIHGNHSRAFWDLVEENCDFYKEAKKILKE